MDLSEIGWGEGLYGVDSVGSGQGPVAGSCEQGDEPSGSGTMELLGYGLTAVVHSLQACDSTHRPNFCNWHL
jgi:hypothetical protein